MKMIAQTVYARRLAAGHYNAKVLERRKSRLGCKAVIMFWNSARLSLYIHIQNRTT